MTPITIEPNSGVKMAGVKIKKVNWGSHMNPVEIIFVSKSLILAKSPDGIEVAWDHFSGWLLYEEPKPEVKLALAAFKPRSNAASWEVSKCAYKSIEDVRNAFERWDYFWPARFDVDGFLIIPEEFK